MYFLTDIPLFCDKCEMGLSYKVSDKITLYCTECGVDDLEDLFCNEGFELLTKPFDGDLGNK